MTIERIIELLEIEKECILRNATGECNRDCAKCDLVQDDTELQEMYTEVIAMTKAQEPRVMTLEEVLHLKFDDIVFFELSATGVVISAIVIDVIEHMPDGDIGLIQFRHIQEPTNNADLEYYGKTWRCWTSRPTDEQRAAEAWPDLPEA
jgi:hypothetical protein